MKKLYLLLFNFHFLFFTLCQAQVITTIGGNGVNGYSGDGGPATNAEIAGPYSIVLDNSGNIYIADGVIRKINTSGIVSTVAGIGIFGYSGDGGPATAAEVAARGVAIDKTGNIFIADMENNVVRKVNTAGVISTYAGNGYRAGSGLGGYSGDGGPATAAEFFFPEAVACDKYGNIFVADTWNQVIRKIDTMGIISTIGGNGFGSGSNFGGYSGDGGPATNAEFNQPCSVATDDTGNIFIADYDNLRIRKINTSGIINTVAGENAVGYSGDGGTAASAELSYPTGIAVYDTIYLIADMGNDRVRKVNSSGIINTIAGIGSGTYSGDGGLATAAELWGPYDAIADSSGNILIADLDNNRVRKIWMSLNVSANVVTQVNCYGDITASASVVASNGISPYTYSWFPNGGSDTFATGLSAGTYTVNITDSIGTKGSATVTITQPPAISISADSINATGSNCNGSVWVVVNGGTFPYSYLWSGGLTTDTITNQCAGNYCSIITDAHGCMDSVCVNIESVTGFQNTHSPPSIEIYPNPINSDFTIELLNPSGVYNFELYNILGEKISFTQLKTATTQINMSSDAKGIYLYRVLKEDGELIGEGRIIIDR